MSQLASKDKCITWIMSNRLAAGRNQLAAVSAGVQRQIYNSVYAPIRAQPAARIRPTSRTDSPKERSTDSPKRVAWMRLAGVGRMALGRNQLARVSAGV